MADSKAEGFLKEVIEGRMIERESEEDQE